MTDSSHPTPPRQFVACSTSDTYDGAELRPFTGRPGANDANDLPSRYSNELRYRDGRVEVMA